MSQGSWWWMLWRGVQSVAVVESSSGFAELTLSERESEIVGVGESRAVLLIGSVSEILGGSELGLALLGQESG